MGFRYKLIAAIFSVFLLCSYCKRPTGNGSGVSQEVTPIEPINQPALNKILPGAPVPLKNMFGVNGYEWNFLENPNKPNDRKHIYEDKYALIKTFSAVRHHTTYCKYISTFTH